MSHFTVLVVGENPEEQLAPFNEQDDAYTESEDITEEALAKYQSETEERVLRPDGSLREIEWIEESDKDFPALKCHVKGPLAEGETLVDVPVRELKSFHEFVCDYYGESDVETDEDGQTRVFRRSNPDAKWDWCVLGGRWAGYFKLKAPASDDSAVLGEPGVFGNEPRFDCDQAYKGDIDFEGMREAKAEEAGEQWDKVHQALDGAPIPKPWHEFRKDFADIDKARKAYNKIEAVKRTRDVVGFFGDVTEYNCTREAYCQRARNWATATFAVLKDDVWYERGSMGWWGCVADEKDGDAWAAEFSKLVDQLPPETLLSVYDCHI